MGPRGPARRRAFEQVAVMQLAAIVVRVWAIPVYVWTLAKPLPRKRFAGWMILKEILQLALQLIESAGRPALCRKGERRGLRRNAIVRKVFSGEIPGCARPWRDQTAE